MDDIDLQYETEQRRRRKLRKLMVNRVDLVTRGANPGAKVMIFKVEEIEKRIVERDGEFCVQSKDGSRSFGCYPSREAAQRRLAQVEHFSKDIKRQAKALGATDLIPDTFKDVINLSEVEDKTEQAEEVEMSEQVEKTETPTPDLVAKAEFDAVRKALEEAQGEITKMRRDQREKDFIAKAKIDFEQLGSAEHIGRLLVAIADKVDEDTLKSLDQLLKAANAQMDKGKLFAQFGSQAEESVTDPYDRITLKAQEMVDAGAAKSLNEARLQVLKNYPELANEYAEYRRTR